jgi:hypothetical protein
MARRRALQVAAVGVMGAILVTCTGESTAPRPMMRLSVAPHFVAGAAVPGNALTIDQVRALVIRPPQDTVVDQTFPFPAGASSVPINLTVPLQQSPDSFSLHLEYEHGTEVLYSGVQAVSLDAGAAPQPVAVPVSYSGPGIGATSLTLAPRDTQINSGDQLQFRVTVLDSGAVPDSLYVGWRTSNPGQAVDATGHLKATLVRGIVTVYAQSPTPPGLQDSTTVHIVPKPTGLVKVSGDGQTGTATTPLPLPLVVQVNGSDLLGVPGVPVTFAVATGGGSVDTANVVTDSLGRASTGVTLGPSTGNQTFTASAIGLTVTFAANGSAAPPKTWTGAVSTDWNVAGNWTPSGVPTAADSVTIPNTANQPVMHTGSYSVNGLSILSGVTLAMDTAVLTDLGGFGDAGGIQDFALTSSLILAGAGKTFSGQLGAELTIVQGSYALNGSIQSRNLEVVGGFTLGGHFAAVIGTFITAGAGTVTMTNAADTLNVSGNVAFGGGNTGGLLTAGELVVGGNFAQSTATPSFSAGPGHTTLFDGSTQSVVIIDSTGAQFGNLEISNASSVSFLSPTIVSGNVTLDSNTQATSPNLAFNQLNGLDVFGSVTTGTGSLLQLGTLEVAGVLTVGGSFNTTQTVFDGTNQTIPAGVPYQFLYVNGLTASGAGTVTFAPGAQTISQQIAVQGGSLTLSANVTSAGQTFSEFGGVIDLNGHTLTTPYFTTDNNGLLKMTNSADTLYVPNSVSFGGGNEAGLLTAGGIFVGGFFTQIGNAQSFAASGSFGVAFNGGGTQEINFANPGAAGGSHFQNLLIANPQGALGIQSDIWILGGSAFAPGMPKIVNGGGQVVHFTNLGITGVTFNNVAIAYDAALGGNNLIALDSVTFTNYNVNSATPLITIASPGYSLGGPFFFSNLTFGTTIGAGTGTYLSATGPAALLITVTSNLAVAEGSAHTVTSGGAGVTWQ